MASSRSRLGTRARAPPRWGGRSRRSVNSEDAAVVLRSGGEGSSGRFVAAADQWRCPLSDACGKSELGLGGKNLELMSSSTWMDGSLAD